MAADTCSCICPPAVVVIEPWGMQWRRNSGASLPSFCRFYKTLQEKENKKVYACHIVWLAVNLQDCWCYSSCPMETDGLNSRMMGRLRGPYQGPPFLTSYRTKTSSLKQNVQLSESSQLFVKKTKKQKTSQQFLREQYVFVPSGGRFSNYCPNNFFDLLWFADLFVLNIYSNYYFTNKRYSQNLKCTTFII